ncbi:MAG: AsnC family transcriptional regulator [Rhodospirillaceae bacterium BRH_c57]|nr:MAG: AsnC family transcriptional regulator [Rhodospirillaceae bacterium BRH_c57]
MTPLQSDLLDIAQRDFPLSPRPYAELALRLGVREDDVIGAFTALRDARLLSRIGAVYRPGSAGASTLAAIAVPPEDLDAVAAVVTAFPEVNHNYERENAVNLWFVVTAPDEAARDAVLDAIEDDTGLAVLRLPMVEDYHLDLGFLLSRS